MHFTLLKGQAGQGLVKTHLTSARLYLFLFTLLKTITQKVKHHSKVLFILTNAHEPASVNANKKVEGGLDRTIYFIGNIVSTVVTRVVGVKTIAFTLTCNSAHIIYS